MMPSPEPQSTSSSTQQQHDNVGQQQLLFLPVGTEVSAKFKGAFCEARVMKLVKTVRIKVLLKDTTTLTVEEALIQAAKKEINQQCEIHQGKQILKGQIVGIKDCSAYTVVFNDGDERVLKRTMLRLKSGRHFKDHETLDKLPLNHPDKITKIRKGKKLLEKSAGAVGRLRRSASVSPLKGMGPSRSATRRIAAMMQIEESATKRSASAAGDCPAGSSNRKKEDEDSSISSKNTSPSPTITSTSLKPTKQEIGKPTNSAAAEEAANEQKILTAISYEDTNVDEQIDGQNMAANESKKSWKEKFPPGSAVLIHEIGTTQKSTTGIKLGLIVTLEEFNKNKLSLPKGLIDEICDAPVRSFHNGRYYLSAYDRLSPFDPVEAKKLTDFGSQGFKTAYNWANIYVSRGELPPSWQEKTASSSVDIIFVPKEEENVANKTTTTTTVKEERQSEPPTPMDMEEIRKDGEKKEATKTNDGIKKKSMKSSEADGTNESSENNGSRSNSSGDEDGQDENEEGSPNTKQKHEFEMSTLVAQFYQFQEESGNEQNLTPRIGDTEIDIYRFYQVVNHLGGHKRVSQESKWEKVLRKLKLTNNDNIDATKVKEAYLCYFEKFEAFMKNLGYGYTSMTASSASSTSQSQRNTRIIRSIEKPIVAAATENKHQSAFGEKKRAKDSQPKGSSSEKSSSGGGKSRSRSASVKDPSPAISIKSSSTIHIEEGANKRRMSFSDDASSVKSDKSGGKAKLKLMMGTKKAKQLGGTSQQQQSGITTAAKTTENEGGIQIRQIEDKQKGTKNAKSTSDGEVNKLDKAAAPISASNTTGTVAAKLNAFKKRLSDQHELTMMTSTSATTIGQLAAETAEIRLGQPLQKAPQQRGRKPKLNREDRVKSPSGHQAIIEDIGFSNAHIFTRFYQGQNVHARHHLRFYDARVITVKQPSLSHIAKSLRDTFELSRITHQGSPELEKLNYENMGPELKDSLRNLMNSTKIFVHYLGWNSRYDEWLMLHKIRVDEKDERSSSRQLEQLIPEQLSPQLVAVTLDWCNSPEGIPSLVSLPSAQSSEQRPRRLSASALAKTAQPGANANTASGESVPGFHQKYSVNAMDYRRSPLNPYLSHHNTASVNSSSSDHQMSPSLAKFTIPHLPSIPPTVTEESSITPTAYSSISTSKREEPSTSSSSTNKSFQHAPPPPLHPPHSHSHHHFMASQQQSSPTAVIYSAAPPIPIPSTHHHQQQKQLSSATSTHQRNPPIAVSSSSTSTSIGIGHHIPAVGQTMAPYSVVIKSTATSQQQQHSPASSSSALQATETIQLEQQLQNVPSTSTNVQSLSAGMTLLEPKDQTRSDTESPFQLPPPPAPPQFTLATAKLSEHQQFGASHAERNNDVFVELALAKREVVNTRVEIILPDPNFSVSNATKSTIIHSSSIPELGRPLILAATTPTKESQGSASPATNTATNSATKKRKVAGESSSSSFSGAMSPPTKILKQHMKSPGRPGGGRSATESAGRSPFATETSDEEENSSFEGHSESLHSLRQRLLHKLEAEHAFDNDDLLGLPNLDKELAKCSDDPDQEVRLIEERMRELHSIYHKYKNELADLERQHRKTVATRNSTFRRNNGGTWGAK